MIFVYNMNKERGSGIVTSVISIIFGLLICLLSAFAYEAMVEIVFTIVGIGIILANIFPLMISIQTVKYDKNSISDLVFSILSIIIGALFIFDHSMILSIICGVFLVLIPIVRIIAARNRMDELKRQLPLFIVALLMFFNVNDIILKVALIVIGAILALLGIVNLVMELIYSYKHKDDVDYSNQSPFTGGPFGGGFNDNIFNDNTSADGSANASSDDEDDEIIDVDYK